MVNANVRGESIRIFLVDGTPQGLRALEIVGWTGTCLAFSRADYPAARERGELTRTGVYVLVGPDPDGNREEKIYVGEADEVRTRLDTHQKEKDFWTNGFVLATKDDSLNKAHVRYLEARLLQLAAKADRATRDNGTNPTPVRLGESEESDMESYLDKALTLLPLVGVTVFDVVSTASAIVVDGPQPSPALEPTKYLLHTVDTVAEGRDDPRGFTVLEGALARKSTKVMSPGYEAIRKRLIDEKILVPHNEKQLRLTKTYVFDSPSSAASVLSGGSKNGRDEWRRTDGTTLKQDQEASAGA